MISIINKRAAYSTSSLFHYAHFICDCLYPEVINEMYNFETVHRLKTLKQTIGNFSKIYEEVMKNKSIELPPHTFINTQEPFVLPRKENYIARKYMNIFRRYIFNRYDIKSLQYIENYPEVLLIRRGERVELINDTVLKNSNKNVSTGAERREIKGIHRIELFLQNKYSDKFKSLYLEDKPFEEQIKLFNNAKIIVLAHGAAMSNMFFCKKGTKIIEITCGRIWKFFDIISSKLKLHHVKIHDNNPKHIIDVLSRKNNMLDTIPPTGKSNVCDTNQINPTA